jgi:hypothetical protein
LKNEGFQGNFPVSILACGEEVLGRGRGAAKAIFTVDSQSKSDLGNLSSNYLLIYMKKMDLMKIVVYDSSVQGDPSPVNSKSKGATTMKLAIRIFAMSIVFVGAAAASVSSATTNVIPSHLSATATRPTPNNMPVPGCFPSACTGN